MDAVCSVSIDLRPWAAHVAGDVEGARQEDSPGGKTITPEERDAIEKRAEATLSAAAQAMLEIPHPCSKLAGGIMLRGARDTAKGLVKDLIDGAAAPATPGPTPAPAPGPTERAPRTPVRPSGRTLEA